jgi:tetratricopeptide (TPR) repeat protein
MIATDDEQSRPLLDRAIREKVLGPEHRHTATSLNNLAYLLQAQGDLAGARPLFERALAINEKAFGPEHPATARAMSNLARVLRDTGHANEADAGKWLQLLKEIAPTVERATFMFNPATAPSKGGSQD